MSGLPDMIASLRKLMTLGDRTAAIAAPKVDQAIKATAAAGTSPDGTPWAPTKTGGRPMRNAASHIETQALGPVVRTTLSGVDVFWHYGAKGAPRRPVIPDGGVAPPAGVEAALEQASAQAFDEITGGRP